MLKDPYQRDELNQIVAYSKQLKRMNKQAQSFFCNSNNHISGDEFKFRSLINGFYSIEDSDRTTIDGLLSGVVEDTKKPGFDIDWGVVHFSSSKNEFLTNLLVNALVFKDFKMEQMPCYYIPPRSGRGYSGHLHLAGLVSSISKLSKPEEPEEYRISIKDTFKLYRESFSQNEDMIKKENIDFNNSIHTFIAFSLPFVAHLSKDTDGQAQGIFHVQEYLKYWGNKYPFRHNGFLVKEILVIPFLIKDVKTVSDLGVALRVEVENDVRRGEASDSFGKDIQSTPVEIEDYNRFDKNGRDTTDGQTGWRSDSERDFHRGFLS